jgi:hypothetical protein
MPKRKKDCVLIKDQKVLMWKNDQGYEVSRVFFTVQFLMDFYESLR